MMSISKLEVHKSNVSMFINRFRKAVIYLAAFKFLLQDA